MTERDVYMAALAAHRDGLIGDEELDAARDEYVRAEHAHGLPTQAGYPAPAADTDPKP